MKLSTDEIRFFKRNDYEGFFKGLKEGGFDGVATFEMCSPLRGGGSLENLDFCSKRYLEWVDKHGL